MELSSVSKHIDQYYTNIRLTAGANFPHLVWVRMTTTAAGREQNQQRGKSPLQMWSNSHHKPHHESPSDFKHWVEKSFKLCRSYFTAGIFKWSSSGVPFQLRKMTNKLQAGFVSGLFWDVLTHY